jgi:hypothetical protein
VAGFGEGNKMQGNLTLDEQILLVTRAFGEPDDPVAAAELYTRLLRNPATGSCEGLVAATSSIPRELAEGLASLLEECQSPNTRTAALRVIRRALCHVLPD